MSIVADITKGMRISAMWMDAKPVALAGVQMKFGATQRSVTGKITHIYGDHPTRPTKYTIVVAPEDGGPEVEIHPTWICEIERDGKMLAVKSADVA
jgi:hypothetical protein